MATTSTYTLLQRITLSAQTSSVTFSSIPQTGYTDLRIVMSVRDTNANTYNGVTFAFNGTPTGTSWTRRQLEGGDGTVNSYTSTASIGGYQNAANSTANTFASIEILVPNYTSSAYKSVAIDSVMAPNATTGYYSDLIAQTWSVNSAVTSITIGTTANFVSGCTFSLYAMSALGTTPGTPKALGGDIVRTDGTYWYHAFLNTGTFTPQSALSCDVLTVAGGGGASTNSSGGGGAGGLVYASSQSLTSLQAYAVVIGAGGAGTSGDGLPAAKGSNSQFASLTAGQGGGGAWGRNWSANGNQNGGCGAGMVGGTGSPGTGSQGYAGGTGANSAPNYGAGGGGGMGAAGGNGSSTAGGNGGVGLSTYSSWGAATQTGQNVSGTYYYAGGGGGGINFNSSGSGTGGYGGGGDAVPSSATVANNGMANTGGGGGAIAGSYTGGSGGSGIIIVRYAV